MRLKRFVCITDSHGNHRIRDAILQAREFATYFKPDLLIHLGDNWDLRALRRGASEEDQTHSPSDDNKAAEDTLDLFFGAYAPARKVYLSGNHDHPRLERLLESPKAIIADYAQGALDAMNATILRFADEMLTWDKRCGVFEFEGMRFLHGYNHGLHSASACGRAFGTSIMGHVHAFGTFDVPNYDSHTGYTVACMCKPEQEYNRGHVGTLRQKVGFAYGFLDGPSRFHDVHFARMMPDGKFYLPTEWTNTPIR